MELWLREQVWTSLVPTGGFLIVQPRKLSRVIKFKNEDNYFFLLKRWLACIGYLPVICNVNFLEFDKVYIVLDFS